MKYIAFLFFVLLISQSFAVQLTTQDATDGDDGNDQNSNAPSGCTSQEIDQSDLTKIDRKINEYQENVTAIREAVSHTWFLDGNIQRVFEEYDVNENQVLEVKELESVLRNSETTFNIPAFPNDSDGEEIIQNLIEEFDLDGDGSVNLAEFKIVAKGLLVDVGYYYGVQVGKLQAEAEAIKDQIKKGTTGVQNSATDSATKSGGDGTTLDNSQSTAQTSL